MTAHDLLQLAVEPTFGASDFWDDPERAARISHLHARLCRLAGTPPPAIPLDKWLDAQDDQLMGRFDESRDSFSWANVVPVAVLDAMPPDELFMFSVEKARHQPPKINAVRVVNLGESHG